MRVLLKEELRRGFGLIGTQPGAGVKDCSRNRLLSGALAVGALGKDASQVVLADRLFQKA